MRVSEYSVSLCRNQLVLEDSCARITLESTKNSPNASSNVLLVANDDHLICPVRALKSYVKARDCLFPQSFPLFKFGNGKNYTAREVNNFNSVLGSKLKLHHSHILSSHSFRIMGASEAARAGVDGKTIQAMGRWKSDAFLGYIRLEEKYIFGAQNKVANLS